MSVHEKYYVNVIKLGRGEGRGDQHTTLTLGGSIELGMNVPCLQQPKVR